MKLTKIIATLGPQCEKPQQIKKLIEKGVDVIRLNFSHNNLEWHQNKIKEIRKVSQSLKRPIAIIGDLQGPKIRTGKLVDGKPISLIKNQKMYITTKEILGTPQRISTSFKKLPQSVQPGHRILIADGLLELKVVKIFSHEVLCQVVTGGLLGEKKGINLPDSILKIPALSKQDILFAKMAARENIDYLALSFVRTPKDVINLQQILKSLHKRIPIISKIETPLAIENIESIVEQSDGILIARGDLGVETPLERIPILQKKLIQYCNQKRKVVITATQMLESMIQNQKPTRAEVTDVFNSIIDGTDVTMLSGETAMGVDPINAVQTMKNIILSAEEILPPRFHDWEENVQAPDLRLASALAACTAVFDSQACCIIVFTLSGQTAHIVSKLHPPVPIYALTPYDSTLQQMCLYRGITPYKSHLRKTNTTMVREGMALLKEQKRIRKGETVIVLLGEIPQVDTTNSLKILKVK